MRYQIAITYRCNLSCVRCYQMFDRLPPGDFDSDMTEEAVVESGRMLEEAGIRVNKLRFTGGEPLLHGKVRELYDLVKVHWSPVGCFRIYSSGVLGNLPGAGMARKSPRKKRVFHAPLLISPADHGLPIVQGIETPCNFAISCGRGFDVYGFAPCCRAWSIGRLFGFDVHSREPSFLGWDRLCKHCIYGVSHSDYDSLVKSASSGDIEYPSPVYRDAIEKRLKEGFVPVEKFLDR